MLQMNNQDPVPNSDDDILQLLEQSETIEKGFRTLMQRYQERIYWHIRRMIGGSHEDAADVVQNTFVKVFRGFPQFKKESKLSTWIYRIATNETLTFMTKQQNHITDLTDDELFAMNNELRADAHLDSTFALELLEKALKLLPDKQRLVFNMRYYDEMSYQDIAAITGTSVGALKASYHHALEKVEHFLKKHI